MARSHTADISPFMKRLFPKTAKAGGHLERYPARVFLCAYMVLSHPKVVFNTQGELEGMLASAGKAMLTAFEALLQQLAEPMQVTDRWDITQFCCHVLRSFVIPAAAADCVIFCRVCYLSFQTPCATCPSLPC